MEKCHFSKLLMLTLVLTSPSLIAQHNTMADSEIKQKVDNLMSRLTLADKVGQMTQYAIDVISEGEAYHLDEPHRLDRDKMQKALIELRAGSILNVGGHAYSREHWHEILTDIQDMALGANGIPVLYGIDAIHGTNYTLNATLYPQQIGLAATWNPVLVEQLAEITAYETRASGIPWNFSPVLDIGRDPRWSRMWEGFGEDVYLVTRMGVAMIKGYQGSDIGDQYRVAACLKHYMGYSLPLTGKDRTQAWIPERQLREYVMPMFQASIDAGAASIMVNSADINGVPAHVNKWILTDLLREEMGFEGVVVTDWEDIGYLVSRHKVATDFKDAIRQAINAGIDMAMVPHDLSFPVLLKELVEEDKVPMSRIDESVHRILTMKYKLGLFEKPIYDLDAYPDFNSKKHIDKAYQGAAESITLLKNENGILPLKIGNKILVTGPSADNMNYLNGGWTWTWQGDNEQYQPAGKQTVLEALVHKMGSLNVEYVPGAGIEELIDIEAAVKSAKAADVAVICIGESTYTEKPGDIIDLTLPQAQIDLVNAIATTNTPIVLVITQGRPRIIKAITEKVDAIVYTYLPGLEGGRATADILIGAVNPSGKLPFTYPGAVNDIVPYDHRVTDRQDARFGADAFQPEFEFGHGLSYTTFQYGNLRMSTATVGQSESFDVSVDVTNTGNLPGKEVVQLYTTDKVASIAPSVRRLRAFEKIQIEAGEMKTVTFTLSARDLAFVGLDCEWITEPGEFIVRIDELSMDFEVK
jgi:beta-glucosidase